MPGLSKRQRCWENDMYPRMGGRVRVWPSVDSPGKICIDTYCPLSIQTVRMNRAETRRLIRKLESLLEG